MNIGMLECFISCLGFREKVRPLVWRQQGGGIALRKFVVLVAVVSVEYGRSSDAVQNDGFQIVLLDILFDLVCTG